MSLVGSLEDLGLVDILQIVSLSRKSGVLSLRSECGQGHIVLCDGLVRGAGIKGAPETLRDLLGAAGAARGEDLERSAELAHREGLGAAEAVQRVCGLGEEQIEEVTLEHVERAVMRMFGWRSGEFSFEIRDSFAPEDEELLLASGLNTQYLAMEATRLGDERSAAGGPAPPTVGDEAEAPAEELTFSGEAESAAAPESEPEIECAAAGVDAAAPAPAAAQPQPAASRPRAARHLIVVDPDLSGLEWFKASVEPMFRRVHIFQRCDGAIDRVRQYLVRGVVPIVVLSESCGVRDPEARGMVRRLRGLSAGMTVLSLRIDGSRRETPGDVDGTVVRPAQPTGDPDRWHLYEGFAGRLRHDLESWLQSDRRIEARRQARGALGRLKRVSDRLRDPSSQGEVLGVVLEFAAEHFARVALFMVREGTCQGIAQTGLPATGGPDDDGLRGLEIAPGALPELFARVLEQRSALRSNMAGARERELSLRLGHGAPAEAYAAPIESSGDVVALVYGDNYPEDGPIRDTTAFEIVLHEAGLALDRAVLERALAVRGQGD